MATLTVDSNKYRSREIDMNKISYVDQLLLKNQQIYKNLRQKLQGITKAERNITNNINIIRPLSYGTKGFETSIEEQSISQVQERYNTSSNHQVYQSSPIQTERHLHDSLKNRLVGQNQIRLNFTHNQDQLTSFGRQNYVNKQNETEIDKKNQPKSTTNAFKKDKQISLMEKKYPLMSSNNASVYQNLTVSPMNKLYFNQIGSLESLIQKQNIHPSVASIKPSAQLYQDSLDRLSLNTLKFKKNEIQQIYQQLKHQQDQIEKAYQDYKRGFFRSYQKHHQGMKAKTDGKVDFEGGVRPRPFETPTSSGISSIAKNDLSSMLKEAKSNKKEKMEEQGSRGFQTGNEWLLLAHFQNQTFPCSSALCIIFVPFNKLYKSPILQMKNPKTLILARHSKLNMQKTQECKIVDGRKFKFLQNIETDQQQLVKKVIREGQFNCTLAIVGGQSTLKKKLHMASIAHAYQRMLRIISSTKYNFLLVSLIHSEYDQKLQKQNIKVEKNVGVGGQTGKMQILTIERTIESIYEAIKYMPSDSSFTKNPSSIQKNHRIFRFTKMSLMFGQTIVWTCQILSTNQYSFDLLKNLGIKNIVWTLNPLIKNYEEVARTVEQAKKYEQNKGNHEK